MREIKPPSPSNLHHLVKQLKAVEFGVLRFLAVCMWDDSDDEGWLNFRRVPSTGGRPLAMRLNDDDLDHMASLEALGALQQKGDGKLYRIVRLTSTGWAMLAYVSSVRRDGDPGWRHRWQPWDDNTVPKPSKTAVNRASTPARSDGSEKCGPR